MNSKKHVSTHKTSSINKNKQALRIKAKKHQRATLLKRLFPFNRFQILVIVITLIIGVGIIVYFRMPFSRSEVRESDIPYKIEYIQDTNLELGQEQIRQNGENGIKETTFKVKHTLAGRKLNESVLSEKTAKSPTSKTIARGTKKYQYMLCSNGGYRFYSNDEFKNPNIGFTHQNPDYCAQNNQGHMTGLADSAPAQSTTSVYQRNTPSYTAPTRCHTQYNTYGGYFDPTATTTCY